MADPFDPAAMLGKPYVPPAGVAAVTPGLTDDRPDVGMGPTLKPGVRAKDVIPEFDPDAGRWKPDAGTRMADALDPEPSTVRAPWLGAGLLAHQAVQQPQAQAATNLTTAKAQNLPPEVVAADPLAAQRAARQEEIRQAFATSPALASYAAQGAQQAAVVQEEAPQYGFVTRWLTGTHGTGEGRDLDEALGQQGSVGMAIGRAAQEVYANWEQFQAHKMKSGGWLGVGVNLLSGLGLTNPTDTSDLHAAGIGGEFISPEIEAQQKKADELTQLAQYESPLEKQSAAFPRKVVGMAAGIVPYVTSPELTLPLMFTQTVGGLNAAGVSPQHAVVGGAIATLLGAKTADTLASSMASPRDVNGVQKMAADWITKLISHPATAAGIDQFGRHAVYGWATAAGMDFTQRVTSLVDSATKTGRSIDPSEYWGLAKASMAEALKFLPIVGLTSGLGLIGQHMEAHANGMSHDAQTVPLADTKVPPAEAKEIFQGVQPQEPPPVEPSAPAPKPSVPGKQYKYIDVDHFDKVMRAAGEDPESVAAAVTEDPFAYRHARMTGTKLEVPAADYLTTLAPFHEALRGGVAEQADGATLSREHGGWLAEESAEANRLDSRIEPPPSELTPEQTVALDAARQATPGGLRAANPPPKGAQPANLPTEAVSVAPGPLGALKAMVDVEPTPKGLKVYAEAHAEEQTVSQLEDAKTKYAKAARDAQRQIDKKTGQTIDLLASAEQSAQQGIDEATQAATAGQAGIVFSEAARTTTAKKLANQIKKIITTGRMAGIDPANIPEDVAGVVQAATKAAAKQAVKDADLSPQKIQTIIKTEVQAARDAFRKAGAGRDRAEDKSEAATVKTVQAGDKAAEIDTLQKQRDLSNAMEAARVKALAVTDKLIGKLRGYATKNRRFVEGADADSVRAKLYKGGDSFGAAHDFLMEALDLRTPDGSNPHPDFASAVLDLMARGHPLDFDVNAIGELTMNPRPLGGLKPGELANVVKASDNLRHLASEESKNYVQGKMQQRADITANDIAPSVAAGATKGPWTKTFAQKLNFHSLLQPLGEWGKSSIDRAITVIANRNAWLGRVADAYSVPDGLVGRMSDPVELPSDWPQAVRDAHPSFTRGHLWTLAHIVSTEEGMGAAQRSLGWEPEQIHGFLESNIPKEEWDSFQQHKDLRDELGRQAAATLSNEGGVPMKFKTPRTFTARGETYEGFYAPVRWLDKGGLPFKTEMSDPTHGISQAMHDDFLKDQQEGVTGVLDLSWKNQAANYRDVINYVTMSDFVRDTARMFNDPGFKAATAPLGPEYRTALQAWHDTMRTGQTQNQGDPRFRVPWVSEQRSNVARTAFMGNLRSVIGLAGHLPILKATYGDDFSISAAMTGISPEKWRFADANSPEVVVDRSQRYVEKLNEALNQQSGGQGPSKPLQWVFDKFAMLWHGADTGLTHMAWIGFYGPAFKKLGDHEAAKARANELTHKGMPAIDQYSKSLQSTDPIIGVLSLTHNFQSTLTNLNAQREWAARSGEIRGGMAGYYLWRAGVTAAVGMTGYALYGEGRNELEQKEGGQGWGMWGTRQMAEAWAYPGPLAHILTAAMSPVLEAWGLGHKAHISDVLPGIVGQNMTNILRDLNKEVINAEGKQEVTPALKSGLDLAGHTLGLPPPALVRSADGLYKVARYRLLGEDGFKGRTPQTAVGDIGKILNGDTDKYRTSMWSDIDQAIGGR